MYTIHTPAAPLRNFIECYWLLKTNLQPAQQLEEQIFADGRADIVFSCDSPYLRRSVDGVATMRSSNLDAQRRYPVHIIQYGQIYLVGVRFRPGGLAAFLPMPLNALDGLTLGLHESFGRAGQVLEERLFVPGAGQGEQRALLDQFFLQRLAVRAKHTLVHQIAAEIEQQRGVVRVSSLSRTYGYSVRMLDRMFLDVMGFTPKFYARIVRFRHSLKTLVQRPGVDWAEIIEAGAYYDQAHFIKEFVEFSGLQPEVYRARLRQQLPPSAPNFVQFLQENHPPIG